MAAFACFIIWWRWVGYQGHDDAFYASAALAWRDHFPPLANNHWSLRYPLILPIALAMKVVGLTIYVLATTNLAAFVAFLIFSYVYIRSFFGALAAAIATLLYLTIPIFPVQATYANPDLVEMVFLCGAFWLFVASIERGASSRTLLLIGGLVGLGFLTRETSIAFVPFAGLAFLFRPGFSRVRYILIAIGFSITVGIPTLALYSATGDPLYRYRISANHDTIDRDKKVADAHAAGNVLDSEGVVAISAVLSPFTAIFISQKFGLLFYFALPATLLALRRKSFVSQQRRIIAFAATASACSFVFVAVNSEILYIVPRYLMFCAALAVVPTAVVLARYIQDRMRWRRLGELGFIALLSTSIALLYLENTNPMSAEFDLAAFVENHALDIHVDPITAFRLDYILRTKGLADRISRDPPTPGSTVLAVDGFVAGCLDHPGCGFRDRLIGFRPTSQWVEVKRWPAPSRAIGGLLHRLGLSEMLPKDILKKVVQPGSDAIAYLVKRDP